MYRHIHTICSNQFSWNLFTVTWFFNSETVCRKWSRTTKSPFHLHLSLEFVYSLFDVDHHVLLSPHRAQHTDRQTEQEANCICAINVTHSTNTPFTHAHARSHAHNSLTVVHSGTQQLQLQQPCVCLLTKNIGFCSNLYSTSNKEYQTIASVSCVYSMFECGRKWKQSVLTCHM